MRVGIAGAGAVGLYIASDLRSTGHDVLIIEQQPGSQGVLPYLPLDQLLRGQQGAARPQPAGQATSGAAAQPQGAAQ